MNISTVMAKLRKGRKGNFRPLKEGEEIQESDITVGPAWFSEVSHQNIGQKVMRNDTIMRLEFDR